VSAPLTVGALARELRPADVRDIGLIVRRLVFVFGAADVIAEPGPVRTAVLTDWGAQQVRQYFDRKGNGS
jgi:hypothetical protein